MTNFKQGKADKAKLDGLMEAMGKVIVDPEAYHGYPDPGNMAPGVCSKTSQAAYAEQGFCLSLMLYRESKGLNPLTGEKR